AFHGGPDVVVLHKKEFGLASFLAQRYHYSRSFAAMRLRGAPRWKRLAYAAATALLPGVLLARMTAAVLKKGRHRKWFVRALPAVCVFVVSWAVGECVGALWGPGRSLELVEESWTRSRGRTLPSWWRPSPERRTWPGAWTAWSPRRRVPRSSRPPPPPRRLWSLSGGASLPSASCGPRRAPASSPCGAWGWRGRGGGWWR